MSDDYTVDSAWMNRVREVVDYGIDNGMYVILNTHHEEWYFPNNENKEQDIEQLKALWTQIAEEFKGYDEHLIISVHAYLPYSFALDTKGTDQFDAATDGGVIDGLFQNLDSIFLSKKIPVIVGEYGSVNKDFNVGERVECVTYYLNKAEEYGVPCVWWDNNAFVSNGENFGLLERTDVLTDDFSNVWEPQEVVDAIMAVYND